MTALLQATGIALEGRLEPCDVELRAGELAIIVGPNGAGKTTLLRGIAGIGEASGRTFVDGRELSQLAQSQRCASLSFMGASRDMAWPLRAIDYVALVLNGPTKAERAMASLASMRAEVFADRRTDTLSTGERTRVMLARTLAPQSKVVLLDEPCANLDPQWRIAAIERLREEAGRGAALLLSSHDLDLALDYADRVLVMHDGAIAADDAPEQALDKSRLSEIFGVTKDDKARWQRA